MIQQMYQLNFLKNNFLKLFKNHIPLSEIILLEAEENYTHLHFENGKKMTIAKTLKSFEKVLREQNFYRIHRAFLINGKHLKSYNFNIGEALMTNNYRVIASRRRKIAFEGLINWNIRKS
jgi:two-component system, LytTR family, response regulator